MITPNENVMVRKAGHRNLQEPVPLQCPENRFLHAHDARPQEV